MFPAVSSRNPYPRATVSKPVFRATVSKPVSRDNSITRDENTWQQYPAWWKQVTRNSWRSISRVVEGYPALPNQSLKPEMTLIGTGNVGKLNLSSQNDSKWISLFSILSLFSQSYPNWEQEKWGDFFPICPDMAWFPPYFSYIETWNFPSWENREKRK